MNINKPFSVSELKARLKEIAKEVQSMNDEKRTYKEKFLSEETEENRLRRLTSNELTHSHDRIRLNFLPLWDLLPTPKLFDPFTKDVTAVILAKPIANKQNSYVSAFMPRQEDHPDEAERMKK